MSCVILVFVNLDGMTAAAFDGTSCDSRNRVSLFGSYLPDLNPVQRQALVDLVYRRPGAHLEGFRFYDGDLWAKSDTLKELP